MRRIGSIWLLSAMLTERTIWVWACFIIIAQKAEIADAQFELAALIRLIAFHIAVQLSGAYWR